MVKYTIRLRTIYLNLTPLKCTLLYLNIFATRMVYIKLSILSSPLKNGDMESSKRCVSLILILL